MKGLIVSNAIAIIAMAISSAPSAADVIVPVGDDPCEVKVNDKVRITAKGIAGSKIVVQCPNRIAKLEGPNRVIERNGGTNVVGNITEEYTITPTVAGTVVVKVTITPPQKGADPIVKEYTLEVK